MTTNEALDTVIGIASLWGEIEDAFRFRLDAEDSDERVKEAVDYNNDGDPVPSDVEESARSMEGDEGPQSRPDTVGAFAGAMRNVLVCWRTARG